MESSAGRSPNRPRVFGQNVLHARCSCYNICICKSMLFLKVLLIRLQMVVVYESFICNNNNNNNNNNNIYYLVLRKLTYK